QRLAPAHACGSSTATTPRAWWTRTPTTALASRWLQTDEQLSSSSQKLLWWTRRSSSARSTGWPPEAWRAKRTSECSVSDPPLAVNIPLGHTLTLLHFSGAPAPPQAPVIEGVLAGIAASSDGLSKVASCEALNGFPKPNITWYRNNAPLVSTSGQVNSADAADQGVWRVLLRPEYADVQGAEGGQRRSLLL
ncbi:unnamed protein product, partial [Tetraodon nigroviridis]